MQRCLVLHDASSQSQHSSGQRRDEIMNEGQDDDAMQGYSDLEGGDMPPNDVSETQEDEEVYRVNVDDDTHPLNEFTHDTFRVSAGKSEQRSRLSSHSTVRHGSNSQRSVGRLSSNVGSGARGSRRRQYFETTIQDTIAGYTEFQ